MAPTPTSAYSSAMLAKHRRGQGETHSFSRSCHPDDSQRMYIFIAPWSSPFSRRPSRRWLPSLSVSSTFCICFFLIFFHLVITSAEKIKNRSYAHNSPALPGSRTASSGHIYFSDNPYGSNGDTDRSDRVKPKSSSSNSARDAFASLEGSGAGSNNPNEDDEDDEADDIEGSGSESVLPNPDDSVKPQGTNLTTISAVSSTTTTEASTTTTTTSTPSTTTSTTTTTTTLSPSTSSTLDPGRMDLEDEDDDIEGSGSIVPEGSGDKPNEVEPSRSSSTTTTTTTTEQSIGFISSFSPSTVSSTTASTTTTEESDYPEQPETELDNDPAYPDPNPGESTDDSRSEQPFPPSSNSEDPDRKPPTYPSFIARPGILAAIIGGTVVGLLCAIILVMFIVYRMRKKDEGSYPLEAHTFRGNKWQLATSTFQHMGRPGSLKFGSTDDG